MPKVNEWNKAMEPAVQDVAPVVKLSVFSGPADELFIEAADLPKCVSTNAESTANPVLPNLH